MNSGTRKINEIIRMRRKVVGLEEIDVADALGMTIYSYGDIESYEHEFSTRIDPDRPGIARPVLGARHGLGFVPGGRRQAGI